MSRLFEKFAILKRSSAFSRIFYQLVLLLLIVVTGMGFIFCSLYARDVSAEVTNNNYLMLQQNQKDIDNEIVSTKAKILQIGGNRSVTKILRLTNEELNKNYETVQSLVLYLNSFTATDDLIDKAWIYLDIADSVLASDGKMSGGTFYGVTCVFGKEIDLERLKEERNRVIFLGMNSYTHGLSRQKVLLFGTELPIAERYDRGYVIISLDDELFSARLSGDSGSRIVYNYVFDEEGNSLFNNEENVTNEAELEAVRELIAGRDSFAAGSENLTVGSGRNKRRFTIQCIDSAQTGWRYVSVIPTAYLTEKVEMIYRFAFGILLVGVLLSSMIVYRLISRLNRPIQEILSHVRIMAPGQIAENVQQKGRTEFQIIQNLITDVYQENRSLQETFRKARPVLRERYLNEILNGSGRVDYEPESLQEAGISFPHELFQVIVCEIGFDHSSRYSGRTADILEMTQHVSGNSEHALVYSLLKEDENIVFLINADEEFYEENGNHEFINSLAEKMESSGARYAIGVGGIYRSRRDCYKSYVDSLRAVKYQSVQGYNSVIFIDEVSGSIGTGEFDYSIQTEMQLISETKAGNRQKVITLISEVIDNNLISRPGVSAEIVDNLFRSLLTTAIRTIYDMKLTPGMLFPDSEDLFNELQNRKTINEKREFLEAVFEQIIEGVNHRRNSKHDVIISKAIRYIGEHYAEALSLEIVAEQVRISSSYLGYLFRENTGTSFVDYVNSYRVERSKELLDNTDRSMAEIAEQSGFGSYNRYVKVFKALTGVTPSQYKTRDK